VLAGRDYNRWAVRKEPHWRLGTAHKATPTQPCHRDMETEFVIFVLFKRKPLHTFLIFKEIYVHVWMRNKRDVWNMLILHTGQRIHLERRTFVRAHLAHKVPVFYFYRKMSTPNVCMFSFLCFGPRIMRRNLKTESEFWNRSPGPATGIIILLLSQNII
jgi:hypothetical protein